ncbi:hypothetical protein [Nocardiopsis listeri]
MNTGPKGNPTTRPIQSSTVRYPGSANASGPCVALPTLIPTIATGTVIA